MLGRDFIKNEYSDLVNKIDNLAPIKFILKSQLSENEILEIYQEMADGMKKFALNKQIDSLEKKLINNMDEKTYQQILELKKQLNNA